MTAVLQATDILRKDRMGSMDDNSINFSSPGADWKSKYLEVADMLAETRAELDDFHHSSKELEEELERELERTEKAQQELKVKVARAEQERDDWKTKFMSLQTTHNTTTTSLQRELDKLRQDYQKIKVQLRELEMGNDDLERSERAISSSLADMEQKYARVLEEKILLEHELLDKANMEEEGQRVKDELRDANEEIAILKDQLAAAQQRANSISTTSVDSSTPSSLPNATPSLSDEDLLSVPTPPDLCLADLTPPPETPAKDFPTPISIVSPRPTKGANPSTPTSMLQRAGFQPPRANFSTPQGGMSSIARSNTLPGLSPSRLPPPRTPVPRPAASRATTTLNSSIAGTAGGVPSTASRSRGVQMVSEMRARVRVLEQKIHTRVPRLRMGSVTSRTSANAMPPPPLPTKASSSSASPVPSTSSSRASHDDRLSPAVAKSRRQSIDSDGDFKRTPGADTSGWVLIMEDSPSPVKDKEKERRRTSSPTAPTAFRAVSSSSMDSPSSTGSNSRTTSALSQSVMPTGLRRPQSRLSVSTEGRSSVSTNATTSTTSSIPTPSSRPSTPTFLPVPSASIYGGAGFKRSTGPGSGAYSQPKRSSLGASTLRSPALDSPSHSTHSNVTIRAPKLPPPSALAQSRIGKPSVSGRRSGGSDTEGLPPSKTRPRSGSTNLLYGRN
ncbi:Nuclear distribution protein nudE -like protein [Trametes pubescens]|uniref:Nuclear distribution protein nudE-like protein n=1 Tax=Trametes pubescens TaxID=154538 RepID=A0A1M2V657_TRAPU|nr:Nuclear distribution protein nudE -like protein [Trametes pubescens]